MTPRMPISTSELIEKLTAAIALRSSHSDPVGGGRKLFLEHVRDLVGRHGLPLPGDCRLDACAMPYIFQELNYDGYDWSKRTEDFGHLSDIVDIDVITWSHGPVAKPVQRFQMKNLQITISFATKLSRTARDAEYQDRKPGKTGNGDRKRGLGPDK